MGMETSGTSREQIVKGRFEVRGADVYLCDVGAGWIRLGSKDQVCEEMADFLAEVDFGELARM